MPASASPSILYTSPQTPVIDQSILKKVNTYQKPLRKWQVSGRAGTSRSLPSGHRRPQPCRSKSVACGAALRAGSRHSHMAASASILRPLSPYGPDKRGLPSFPRFPALRCCGSSVRRGIRCCGLGGQGAWQPSLRSGRLRRPARAEWDNSRRRTALPAVPRADLIDWWKPARR